MQTIRLNLTMSYPVRWSEYDVMRDFIQNFFDATGAKDFSRLFGYKYAGGTLKMWTTDKMFSKEWLYYIGASTKTHSEALYAGRFGEGFKIASLVAYRDLHLSVTMESKDWRIKVTKQTQQITSDKNVEFLAYNVSKREYSTDTVLTLEGVCQELYDAFLLEMKNFYYEGNPRFGECIAKGNDYAIYHSKDYDSKKKQYMGYVYAGFQKRKSFSLPVIICNHSYKLSGDDRERKDFYEWDTVDSIRKVIEKLKPDEAYNVLELLESCWSGKKIKGVPFGTREIITDLIDIICEDEILVEKFKNKYADKLVARCWFLTLHYRKKQALIWYKGSGFYKKRRTVIWKFRYLGIKDIESLCESEGGYDAVSEPDDIEQRYIAILEEAATKIMGELIVYDELPQCLIIANKKMLVKGLAKSITMYNGSKNKMGLQVKRSIKNVYMQRNILFKGFSAAFPVYVHELLHQFGGDNSLQFHRALLFMNMKIMESNYLIDFYEEMWRQI